jgi:N-acyl-D-aspartate/D-glutamate deacylase
MRQIADANRAGHQMMGQVLTRPTGIMLGFEISQNPFVGRPSWKEIEHLSFAEKMQRLVTPEFRARLIGEATEDASLMRRVTKWDRIFPLGDPPDYEPAGETSVAARAAREGRNPAEVAYDMLLEKGGKSILYRPLSNYTYGTLDTVRDMMRHDASLIGLGDGGAHVGILSDASAMTYMLTHWVRDRTRGPKLPLSWAVKRLTRDNARAIGLNDRGLVARGAKADINIIDFDRLRLHAPEVVYDLPSGGRRLIQKIDGYEATMVSGEIVSRDGKETGKLPGRLVRGAKTGVLAEAAE